MQKYLVQKRFARSISGHQETIARFQDLTVCSIRFRPWKWSIVPCWPNLYRFELKFYATLGLTLNREPWNFEPELLCKFKYWLANVNNRPSLRPCQSRKRVSHGNVKVDSNLVKSGGFGLLITGLKSEIRISKCETISKFENQMTKTFRELIQYLQDFCMFWIWDLCHSYLFRISYFELRIFRKLNKQISSIRSTRYLFKWLSPGGYPESLIAKQSFFCYNIVTSRKLYPADGGKNINISSRPELLPRTWNSGMVENWKVEDPVFSGIGFKVRLTIY